MGINRQQICEAKSVEWCLQRLKYIVIIVVIKKFTYCVYSICKYWLFPFAGSTNCLELTNIRLRVNYSCANDSASFNFILENISNICKAEIHNK